MTSDREVVQNDQDAESIADDIFDLACEIVHGNLGPSNAAVVIADYVAAYRHQIEANAREAGRNEGIEAERAAVVGWMREPRGALQHIINDYAKAIERGDHLSALKTDGG